MLCDEMLAMRTNVFEGLCREVHSGSTRGRDRLGLGDAETTILT